MYVAAIAAYHGPLGEQSLGRNQLVTHFLKGTQRLRPLVHPRMPAWYLAVVLEALSKAPFEPLGEDSLRCLTIMTAFLLAISSLKRVSDLQALSVAPSCLEFAPGMGIHGIPRPIILQAFCPPPFWDSDQEKLNCVDAYVHRAALWRKSVHTQ